MSDRTRLLLAGACFLTLLTALSWARLKAQCGMRLTVTEVDGSLLASYPRADLNAGRINALLARGPRPVRAEWTGFWIVPPPGFAELVLKSDGNALLALDDEELLGTGAGQNSRIRRPVAQGPHRIRISYESDSSAPREIFLKGVTVAGESIPVRRRETFPNQPSQADAMLASLSIGLAVTSVLAWAVLLIGKLRGDERASLKVLAPVVLIGLVTLGALALRFEALVFRYWLATAPGWAEAVASGIRDLRPGAFEHATTTTPYEGDPFSYLTIARTMGAFYEPSSREPFFPALARLSLGLMRNHDIGLNIVSALASALVCVAIFALGARLLSPWSGLLAALLWAIEWRAIAFSVEGWRDDLFTLEVVACAAALVELHLRPQLKTALLLGALGGLTLLTRLSALTFLIPGLLAVIALPSVASRRERARHGALALLGMGLLAGPFMIACAIGFGDPFHAVNVHAAFYRGRAGLPGQGGSTALQFLAQSQLPWGFLQTGYEGLTSFPFRNKWSGFDAWAPGLGESARLLALAGLPVILWRPGGGVALIILFSAIAPYAWTWMIPGGAEWRFTLPAYPFYLISAAIAVEAGLRLSATISAPDSRRAALRYALTGSTLLLLLPWLHRELNWRRVAEAVGHGRAALIEADTKARPFFPSGWRHQDAESLSPTYVMAGIESWVRLPLPPSAGVKVVLRPGTVQGKAASTAVFSGTERLALLSSDWRRGDTATFEVLPGHTREGGVLSLRFVRTATDPSDAPLALLWIRVEPSASAQPR